MSVPIVVVGAGGFGREVLDVIGVANRAAPTPIFEILGVVDSDPSAENVARLKARRIPMLGSESDWLRSGNRATFVVGIGNSTVRERIDGSFRRAGRTAATVIHPGASLGSAVTIGDGSIVCGGVNVSTNVAIGRHVHLNPNSTIGHDSELGDFVSVNPSATISGDVGIGMRSMVGAGAVVLQGLALGMDVVVGANACVVRDVEDGRTVKGVPAR